MSLRFAAAVLAVALPVSASAQGLAHLVPDLILDGITLPGGAGPGNPHNGHFTLGDPTTGGSQAASRADTAAIEAVENFNGSLIRQLTNVPLGSSTGGFTFNFDEKTGTYTRGSNSFGPSFTERANTIGHKKLSAGFTYQHSSFDSFGGLDLKDGSINFYLPHTDCCNAASPPPSPNVPGLEGDLMDASLQLKATADTFAFLTNYGLTPNFDIGLAVPITHVNLEATVNATILRLSTAATPLVHTFVEGQDQIHKSFDSAGSASGIGDIVVRGKYAFYKEGNTRAAAGVDLRLPTGDADQLLGLGATQAKIYGITSFNGPRVSTHVNFGYTFSTAGSADFVLGASDEFNYTGAVEYVAHPRLTLLADFLGRTFRDAGTVAPETKQYTYRPGAAADATVPTVVSQTNPVTNQPYRQLALTPGNLNVLLGAFGGKFNVSQNLLLSGNLLFPISNSGLKDHLTVAFGLDYAF